MRQDDQLYLISFRAVSVYQAGASLTLNMEILLAIACRIYANEMDKALSGYDFLVFLSKQSDAVLTYAHALPVRLKLSSLNRHYANSNKVGEITETTCSTSSFFNPKGRVRINCALPART